MGKTDGKHFAGILDAAGTTEIGLTPSMRNGMPIYSEGKSSALSPQIFTGDTSYGRFNPEEEIAIFQSDYRGGMGLEVQDDTEPRRYFYAIGADGRFRDEIRLGPAPTTVTKVTLPTMTDGELDVWTDADNLTNWTIAAGAITREGTTKYSGNYSMQFDAGGATVQQTLANWSNNFRGKLVTVTAWIKLPGGQTCTLGINDGVGTTTATVTADNTWRQAICSRTLDAAATGITVQLIGSNNTVYVDLVAIATWGSVDSQCDFNGSHYLASGAVLARVDSAGTMYLSAIMPASITQIFPGTSGGVDYLFVLLGWSNAYYYLTTAEAATLSNLTNNTLKFMCVSGATFYGSDTNSTIVSTTNPINGGTNWGTSKQIGEDGYNIVWIGAYGGLIYARKSDCKVFYIDSSGNVQVLIDGQANLSGTNTTLPYVWREEYLLIPFGVQGLFAYDGTTLTDVSPTNYIKGTSDFTGQIQAITGDEKYIYIILDNSTKIEVLTLNYESVEGTSDWRWHGSLAEITLTGCASASITSIYKKRCYIGSSVGSEAFYYIPVCAKYGNIGGDTDYPYQTGGYLITSFYHYNLKGDNKAWIKQVLKMSGTSADIYWQVHYQLFGSSTWTEINSTAKFKILPSTEGFLSSEASSVMIRFKFTGITTGSSVLTLRPTAAGTTTEFDTATSANHYAEVDEDIPDEYTTTIANTTAEATQIDTFNATDHTTEATVINSVTVYARMARGAFGIATAYIACRTVATNYFGSEITLTEDWTTYSKTWTTNPNTSAAWTWAQIDALEIGIKAAHVAADIYCTQVYAEVNYVSDALTSPVLLGFDVRGIWYPTERKTISMQVRVKDGLPTEQGQIDDQLGSTIRSTLDNLNSTTWPRAFYPPYWESSADTIYVKRLPLPGDRQALHMVRNEQDNEYEWVYDLLLLVVPLS